MRKLKLVFFLLLLIPVSFTGIKSTVNVQAADNSNLWVEEQIADVEEQVIEADEQIAKVTEQRIIREIQELFKQLFKTSINLTEADTDIEPETEKEISLAQAPVQPQPQVPPQAQQRQQTQPAQPQPQPQSQSQSPVQQRQPPQSPQPVQPQPPIQLQPQPVQQQQPQSLPPELPQTELFEEETETEEESETHPIREPYQRNLPNAPAANRETLAQRGAVPQGENINFSRVIRVTTGQVLEIPFRGNGWVYLGELASRRGIAYNSRRSEPEGMSFVFNIEAAGTYALKFFREDFTRGYILNDYVQVIAGETQQTGTGWFTQPTERSRVAAEPRWPSAIEEAEIRSAVSGARAPSSRTAPETAVFTPGSVGTSPPASTAPIVPDAPPVPAAEAPALAALPASPTPPASTAQPAAAIQPTVTAPSVSAAPLVPVTQPAAAAPPASMTPSEPAAQPTAAAEKQETISPNTLMQRSKETFESGNVPAAISLLDQYMSYFPGGSDEAYFLYGQFYEANSPSRNILLSLDYYRRLVNEYPQSSRSNEARRRIAYLERFYINIR